MLIGQTYQKVRNFERIRFLKGGEFWYSEKGDWESRSRTWRVVEDGGFELDWGNGAVFRCDFCKTSARFVEHNPSFDEWILHPIPYDNRGSTSGPT